MDNKDKEALLSYVKVTHVCFIITLVCCLLSLTTIFFRTFFDIPVDFLEEYGIELDFFSILYLFEPSVTQVLGIEWTAKKYRTPLIPGEEVPTEWKRQDEDNLKKFNNNLILLLFFKIMACFLLPLALLGFHFSFWGYIYFCAGFYGYMYNVGFISDLISTIMIILLITIPEGLVKLIITAFGQSACILSAIRYRTGIVRSALKKPPIPHVSCPIIPYFNGIFSSLIRASNFPTRICVMT